MREEGDPAELYRRGIDLFNAGDYFECHEVLEQLWMNDRSSSRQFYQGLIQAAVALYHLERRNMWGAHRMFERSRGYLRGYLPEHGGINLHQFLTDFEEYFDRASLPINSPERVDGALALPTLCIRVDWDKLSLG